MIKTLLIVAVLGSAAGFASPAVAQGNPGDAAGSDVAALRAKLAAQCAHRRTMPPDPRDHCADLLRSDAQVGSGQGDATASSAQASGIGPGGGAGAGNGIGPGRGGGQGNGIGPGSGGGQGKGRR